MSFHTNSVPKTPKIYCFSQSSSCEILPGLIEIPLIKGARNQSLPNWRISESIRDGWSQKIENHGVFSENPANCSWLTEPSSYEISPWLTKNWPKTIRLWFCLFSATFLESPSRRHMWRVDRVQKDRLEKKTYDHCGVIIYRLGMRPSFSKNRPPPFFYFS